jgi:NAD(P)-dependent dehydrogenase (short-subunit alcohol dehydrogenase family)
MFGNVNIGMHGKVALVTGGGYGMGRSSSRKFAECGAAVVVADIDPATGPETVEMIRRDGGKAEFVHVDVGDEDGVRDMVDFTVDTFGGLDYAHNNAGILMPPSRFEDYPTKHWEQVLRTNLTGVFYCMKYEIPQLLERGGGVIVNVASETTYKGNVAGPGYTASKHGVVGLTTVAALQNADKNIRVNAIAPGNVNTGIIERVRDSPGGEEIVRWAGEVQPIRRLSEPEEIAEIVVWLCSDSAVLINGAKIAADTGWHIS